MKRRGFLVLPAAALCLSSIASLSSCRSEAAPSLPAGRMLQFELITSRRIPNHQIQISISKAGELERTVTSLKGEAEVWKKMLSAREMERLHRHIEAIGWKEVSKDRTIGLDGNRVNFHTAKAAVSVWAPDLDTEKRKLLPFLELTRHLLSLGELDPTGMPL